MDVVVKMLRPQLEAVYLRRSRVLSDLDAVNFPGGGGGRIEQ